MMCVMVHLYVCLCVYVYTLVNECLLKGGAVLSVSIALLHFLAISSLRFKCPLEAF